MATTLGFGFSVLIEPFSSPTLYLFLKNHIIFSCLPGTWGLKLAALMTAGLKITALFCLSNDSISLSGAVVGITDKMEARPQPPFLILQARTQDEGVSSCDSDLFLPFFG